VPLINLIYTNSNVQVSISVQNGATVYYTTNGATPTTNSTKYTSSFPISATTTIRALAVLSGSANSDIAMQTLVVAPPSIPTAALFESDSIIAIGDSFQIKWSIVDTATHYEVVLSENGSVVETQTTSGAIASFILHNEGKYEVRVRAVNFVGFSGVSSPPVIVEAVSPRSVTFLDWDGTTITELKVKYGGTVEFPASPQREGHRFAGWSSLTGVAITANTDITAFYTIERYTVDFYDVNGTTLLSSQRIAYSSPAVPPTNYTLGAGYIFAGWHITPDSKGVSIVSVFGDTKVVATKTWENPYLPVIVDTQTLTAEKVGDTYTVNVSLSNPEEEITRGRLLTVLKTSDDRMVASNTRDVSLIGGNWSGIITINSFEKATKVEVVVVGVDGDKTGGAYSEKASTQVTVPTGWEYGLPSEWSTQKPTADFIEERTEYRYTTRATATSTTSRTMQGYVYDHTVATTGAAKPWQDTAVARVDTDALKRDVQVRVVDSGHTLVSYCYQRAASPYYRSYRSYNVNGNYSAYSLRSSYGTFERWIDVSDDTYRNAPRVSQGSFMNSGAVGYNDGNGEGRVIDGLIWFYVSTKTKTQYSYQDTTYVHYFYQDSDWSTWSAAEPPVDTLRVETRTVYRGMNKVILSDPADPIGEISGERLSTSGELTCITEDFSGRHATILVYKITNDDPTQGHLQYVGQTLIGNENSFNFSFIPKEELSTTTGDFVVALAIEGSTRIINVDLKAAPQRKYTVTFIADNTELSTQVVAEGEAATVPVVPAKVGHTFIGWDESPSDIRRNWVITAKYARNDVTVVLVDYVRNETEVYQCLYGDTIGGLPEPECNGMIFQGWYILVNGNKRNIDFTYEILADVVVHADWSPMQHVVTFVNQANTAVSTQLVDHGKAAILPGPLASNEMVFTGWSNDTEWWNVTADITVKPVFLYNETAEAPAVERRSGVAENTNDYNDVVNIILLKSSTENATVYYRVVDGVMPENISGVAPLESEESPQSEVAPDELIYVFNENEPITISRDTTIIMMATADGMNDSETVVIEVPYIEPDENLEDAKLPQLFVDYATARPGDIVEMPVYLSNYAGIVSLSMGLSYDSNVLTRVDQQFGGFVPQSIEIDELEEASIRVLEETDDNSLILVYVLKFKVSDIAQPGLCPVVITPSAQDIGGLTISFRSSSTVSNVLIFDALPALILGSHQTANIDSEGEVVYFEYVPTTSGTYTFSSSGSTDTHAALYNADWGELAQDDNSGVGLNFSIAYSLEAGSLYYYGVWYESPVQIGAISVLLVSNQIVNPIVGPPGSGDLDGDGFVTLNEALRFARVVVGSETLNAEQLAAADMDQDGYITMTDVLLAMRRALGI
jgi:hypothetical protein